MLGMLRMNTANIKCVLRMRVIASEEAIFAIAKVKVTKDVWTWEWVRGCWDSRHVAGTPTVI